jgi:hypothetical protein
MAHKTQNRWIYVLWPSFGILITGKHNGSETGSVPVLILRESNTYSAGSLRKS